MNKKMWSTKYALTKGVKEIEIALYSDEPKYAKGTGNYQFTLFVIGRDVFDDKSDALRDAEKRRDKKIKSMEKQLAKLRRMEFKV